MFEKASRLGLRFDTQKGSLTVEDLWMVPLTSSSGMCLDDIAKGLSKECRENMESFVEEKTGNNAILELKFEIVKHIIKTRLEERKARTVMAQEEQRKEKIRSIIRDKKDEELKNMSVEDLEKMIGGWHE